MLPSEEKEIAEHKQAVLDLKRRLKDDVKHEIGALRKRHYMCHIYVSRVRKLSGEDRPYNKVLFLSKIDRGGNMYYDAWNIRFTDDRTEAVKLTVEDAVGISRNLPFENQIMWSVDQRERCPKCDSPMNTEWEGEKGEPRIMVRVCEKKKCGYKRNADA